jgi:GT2 family glycosyltransferase
MPAYEEEALVGLSVEAARSIAGVERVIVVDDGSRDGTAAEAARAGADVLRLEKNVGKGAAVEAGLELAGETDAILLLDADLGGTAAEGDALLAPVTEGRADMTIAVLPSPARKGGLGLVKGLARRGIRRLGDGFEATAPLSGQRALTAEAVRAVRPLASGYGLEVALTVRARRAGLTVLEVPTTMAHAATGRDVAGFAHRGRQYVDVARTLRRLSRE